MKQISDEIKFCVYADSSKKLNEPTYLNKRNILQKLFSPKYDKAHNFHFPSICLSFFAYIGHDGHIPSPQTGVFDI